MCLPPPRITDSEAMDTNANQQYDGKTTDARKEAVEQAMKIQSAKSWRTPLVILLTCAVLSPWLWAQSGDAASQSNNAAAATPKSSNDPGPVAQVKPHDDTFVIGADDVLAISVWKEPDVSRLVPVRSDGKISLPLAGEVQAAGVTPLKLEQDIAGKLQNYISEPEVTVIVQQINSQKFNILGMVNRPGSYSLSNSPTV